MSTTSKWSSFASRLASASASLKNIARMNRPARIALCVPSNVCSTLLSVTRTSPQPFCPSLLASIHHQALYPTGQGFGARVGFQREGLQVARRKHGVGGLDTRGAGALQEEARQLVAHPVPGAQQVF